MASSEADSRLSQVVAPALEKIVKNASWRKHSKLAHECKSVLERLNSPRKQPSSSSSVDPEASIPGPLHGGGTFEYSLVESESILSPLINACGTGVLKIVDPAIDCVQKLIAHGYLRGEADPAGGPEAELLARLIGSVCKCYDIGDDAIELSVLKALLSSVTSVSLRIHGDCLLQIVRTCYDTYLGSKNVVNQTTAKASLIQMLVIVFRRMEADSSTVPVQPIVVADLMAPVEKSDADGSMTMFVQGFITKIMHDIDGVLNAGAPSKIAVGHDGAFETTTVETTNPTDLLDSTDKDMLDAKYWEISMYKTALEGRKGELADGEAERDEDLDVQIGNKLRRDAFLVFRALCKLSMKTPPKEASADPQLMKAKIVALELLKILLENAGAVFRTSDRFLGAIKQYLCLSLLKNSASSLMIVFQLSCSIFVSLVSRFRAGLKAEIGVFFPMIVLRVLENVAQPNFQQKMIVLRFIEKLCVDSQILVDIFINYDCDVNSSNIFERMVNGLLKTAQGAPPGAATSLMPPQEVTLKLEAMKCLVAVLKSMGDWAGKQLRIADPSSAKKLDAVENGPETGSFSRINGNGEVPAEGLDSQSETSAETSTETSDVSSIEERRAYKLELQEGISIFNRKPNKGIEFLINANKVGNSPEEIAAFLKRASGLNKTLIGDYLGEREDLPLKVMHAYVNSFEFQGMEFDEAIRAFLKGFRLPGEAQKIDRIMEKFAERYCKCNPKVFISADTAYVLAYSVILLNTDAHNPMVKNKMSADDFIRNNRGIDDGKDVPEEYLRSLYERISTNEIKMKEDDFDVQQRQSTNSNNRILGLDSILNIVVRKRGEDRHMETSDDLIRHMQEQFKEKAQKSESVYYAATDVVILRFMVEVCWAPMLAAFSVPLDQSDDEVVIGLCLEGFRCAIHVTAVMSMKTHRDAFVTSLAKFTSLHSPADIKQKNVAAIKALVTIADEDGNYLQEAWEHILTCVSRFEHLHLLGAGAPPDATFFSFPQNESEKTKPAKSSILPVLKKKGPGRLQYAAAAAVLRGSYDSAGIGGNVSGSVSTDQMNILVSNFSMLEQVGSSEMNRIFTRSQKLNSEAIIDFVKALCKVSMEELRSTSDPRVFSLTKIVEIAHYNMNRIRLVWSSIWHVLSDFFVTIGCSENLSISIFAMDSLRQLSMKFLEREELANYNFQNEFMKPFVIVMRKSSAVEIRELIIRCVSQMVLSRVKHVKSGWKSMFMVFTTAAYDDHKNIVLLAFEIMEKIIRDYFPYITFFICAGLSELSFDPRPEIRTSSLQILFDTLRNHGHLFSLPLWERVFESVLFPIFDYVRHAIDPTGGDSPGQGINGDNTGELDQDAWLYETCTLALQLVVDLFVKFYNTVNPLLRKVLKLLVSFIRRPHQSLAGIGIAAFVRLMSNAGDLFSEEKWLEVVFSLREAANATLVDFSCLVSGDTSVASHGDGIISEEENNLENGDDPERLIMERLHAAISDAKCRASVQLLLIQAVMEIYNMYRPQLSARNTLVLFDAMHDVASHAHKINTDAELRSRLQEFTSMTQMQDPPLLRLENESFQICLTFLQNLILDRSPASSSHDYDETEVESCLVSVCQEVLQFYITTANEPRARLSRSVIPVGSGKRRELAARGPLIVSTLRAICSLGDASLGRNLYVLFPLLSNLISCEHGSKEVQLALSSMLSESVGPVLFQSC
ncbi:Brefeldin A-inhibited guanine nucleotide-exchange protein 3 [Linum grandiflorum]